MKERRLLILLTFLPLALAVFIWDLDIELTDAPATEQVAADDLPVTIVDNARLTQFDRAGLRTHQVSSTRLVSKDFQQMIDIEAPRIHMQNSQGTWVLQGERGAFHQEQNRISLDGEVQLRQVEGENPAQMRTDHLDYYPARRLATTDAPVIIASSGHLIQSEGIRIDLANAVYTLPSNVRSRHEPL